MKNLYFVSFIFSVLTSSAAFSSSICEQFSNRDLLNSVKTVKPVFETLADHEVAMIQSAVLISSLEEAHSPKTAVEIFADTLGGRSGSLGGEINYYELMVSTNNSSSSAKTFAVVTYYPGDNEYGAIFRIFKSEFHVSPVLVGTITDSDVNCLVPVN
ncbi:MAG: hypothetical protein NT027_13655 [Proteobacteria bacterium]|nr:hypothetical protein [Pseudomonadota bacterium]